MARPQYPMGLTTQDWIRVYKMWGCDPLFWTQHSRLLHSLNCSTVQVQSRRLSHNLYHRTMNNEIDYSGQSTPDKKRTGSNPSVPEKIEQVDNAGTSLAVDAETEKRLLRKLDMRIIPMICWIYLMNFMDRGLCGMQCVIYLADFGSQHWQCAIVRPGRGPRHARNQQSVSDFRWYFIRHLLCESHHHHQHSER